jgi:hypothetical protein
VHVKMYNRSDWRSFSISFSLCAHASAFSCSASNISCSCVRALRAHTIACTRESSNQRENISAPTAIHAVACVQAHTCVHGARRMLAR